MTTKKGVIGVDLGATWLRVALSDRIGNIKEKAVERIEKSSPIGISKQVVRLSRFLCRKHGHIVRNIEGIGIASAGPLIQKKGILFKPVNLPFQRVPLTDPISEDLGAPTFLINDCSGAALAESYFGAAKGIDDVVYVTISTGIGGGAIVNGTLLLGKDGNAHEIGHFTIDRQGRLVCGCGRPGHWEAYCSGQNIPNYVRLRLSEIKKKEISESMLGRLTADGLRKLCAADLFEAAKKKDRLALQLVDEIGHLNAIGFSDVVNAYDPSLITIGGTVTLKNRDMILDPIRRYVGNHALNRIPRIIITPLGEDACVYGGIAAALKYLS